MTTRVHIGDRATRRLGLRSIIREAQQLGLTLQISTATPDRPYFIDFPDDDSAVMFKLKFLTK